MKPGSKIQIVMGDGQDRVVYTGYLRSYEMSMDPGYYVGLGGHSHSLGGGGMRELSLDVSLDTMYREPATGFKLSDAREQFMKQYTPKENENNMERFTATAVRNANNGTVSIYVQDDDGKFVTASHERVERGLGEDRPVYDTIPEEIFTAIQGARLS